MTGVRLAQTISPDTDTVGAFLPYTPVHHLLLQNFEALVMTSGNLSDEPIISAEEELGALVGPIADAALTHNRSIVHKCDDSVLRVVNGQRQFLRRSRGFVPNPIRLAVDSPQILAVGGELKNTFCLVRDGNAFLSQHIGDLKDYKTYSYFSCEIESWKKLMRVQPTVIAHDLHPAYLSTRFAVVARISHKVGVQHHHAHIASVMAEHDLHEPLIGVALDGTGYGTDGTIWGGEFMVADRSDFERVAHFKTYRLPGGDKAVARTVAHGGQRADGGRIGPGGATEIPNAEMAFDSEHGQGALQFAVHLQRGTSLRCGRFFARFMRRDHLRGASGDSARVDRRSQRNGTLSV